MRNCIMTFLFNSVEQVILKYRNRSTNNMELSEEELKNAFSLFDKDGNGTIQSSEFLDLLKSIGEDITLFESKLLFNLCDADASGVLSFSEFKTMLNKQDDWTPEEDLKALFRTVDEDGSGCLSRSEVESLLMNTFLIAGKTLEEGEVDALIKLADTDGDGRINYDELVKVMKDSGEYFS